MTEGFKLPFSLVLVGARVIWAKLSKNLTYISPYWLGVRLQVSRGMDSVEANCLIRFCSRFSIRVWEDFFNNVSDFASTGVATLSVTPPLVLVLHCGVVSSLLSFFLLMVSADLLSFL